MEEEEGQVGGGGKMKMVERGEKEVVDKKHCKQLNSKKNYIKKEKRIRE